MPQDVLVMDNNRQWQSITPTVPSVPTAAIPVFADADDRDDQYPHPNEGALCFVRMPGQMQIFVDEEWVPTGAVFTP